MLYAFDNAPLTTTDQPRQDKTGQPGEFNIVKDVLNSHDFMDVAKTQ